MESFISSFKLAMRYKLVLEAEIELQR